MNNNNCRLGGSTESNGFLMSSEENVRVKNNDYKLSESFGLSSSSLEGGPFKNNPDLFLICEGMPMGPSTIEPDRNPNKQNDKLDKLDKLNKPNEIKSKLEYYKKKKNYYKKLWKMDVDSKSKPPALKPQTVQTAQPAQPQQSAAYSTYLNKLKQLHSPWPQNKHPKQPPVSPSMPPLPQAPEAPAPQPQPHLQPKLHLQQFNFPKSEDYNQDHNKNVILRNEDVSTEEGVCYLEKINDPSENTQNKPIIKSGGNLYIMKSKQDVVNLKLDATKPKNALENVTSPELTELFSEIMRTEMSSYEKPKSAVISNGKASTLSFESTESPPQKKPEPKKPIDDSIGKPSTEVSAIDDLTGNCSKEMDFESFRIEI